MSPSAAICVSAPELLSGQGRAYSSVNKTYVHAVGWLLREVLSAVIDSLSDSLVSSNGIISPKLAGKLRYLDST